MFDSAGQALPLPTQIVMNVAEALQHYGWLLALLLVMAWLWVKHQQTDAARKQRWDAGLLRLPLLGELLLQRETAHFSRTFGTLLGNGVSLVKALAIVRETVENQCLAVALADSEAQVKQGQSLSEALTHYPYFPVLALQMIKMGEETGRLEEMLLRLADIYDKQLKSTIQRGLALLEPALIISLGLLIAGIIVSILLAILSINDLAV
jgi:general secretion pathway protein F